MLDQIDPGCCRWSKIQMVPGLPREPSPNRGRFMRPVVVQNQMNLQINRNSHLYSVQKLSKFKGAMSPMTLPNDLSRFHVEGGEDDGQVIGGNLTSTDSESPFHGLGYNKLFCRMPVKNILGGKFLGEKKFQPVRRPACHPVIDNIALIDIGSNQQLTENIIL
jgi:hypothetical protein